jgi:hypothetical protein
MTPMTNQWQKKQGHQLRDSICYTTGTHLTVTHIQDESESTSAKSESTSAESESTGTKSESTSAESESTGTKSESNGTKSENTS